MSTIRTAAVVALASVFAASAGQAAVRPEVASLRVAPRASLPVVRAGSPQRGEASLVGTGLVVPVIAGFVAVIVVVLAAGGGTSSPR